MGILAQTVKRHRAHQCLDCGKCSAVCPVAALREHFRPRYLVNKALQDNPRIFADPMIWECLACGRCEHFCHLGVQFSHFVRDLREEAWRQGHRGELAHHGVVQTIMRLQADPELAQNRLTWLSDDLETDPGSDTLFFVGCAPYFESLFDYPGVDPLGIAKASIRLLNAVGIRPRLLSDERCCGHDLLWAGEKEPFLKLAQLNAAAIRQSGVSRVVTSCPECLHTLGAEYPAHGCDLGVEVRHIFQLLAENLDRLTFRPLERSVTYLDPCRLGRFTGLYEQPRQLLQAVPGTRLTEMRQNRDSAQCCGTTAWVNCDRCSKGMQMDRYRDAMATGADMLVTACPKCQVHFCCTRLNNRELEHPLEIIDLATLLAGQLEG